MVNDLLNERYLIVRVHYRLLLPERCLTIDKYQVSIVMELAAQNR
ncbi:hypothetical protein FHT72_006407 [Rhizobium sp. BK077]|nr:hypothetical protein [Rhizobium sp. BK112]MBB3371875.1 hypothetical protein [Rhizobium sp. BK077]MBB4182842.1 hypothetical protein [Rhizobium sp. BK109]